nr:patatin-like phospholipase family protein [Patescibacteria group bacterium]
LSFLFDPCFNQGLANGTKFKKFFNDFIGEKDFTNLKIPFSAVATDIKTGSPVTLDQGNIADAVHASSAIPFLFKPITYKDHILADGGLSMPVPVQIVKDMGADIIIAVNLCQEYFVEGYIESLGMSNMFLNSLNILSHHLATEQIKDADVCISPPLKHVRWKLGLSPAETQEIIKVGENMMEREILNINKLMDKKSIPAWKNYNHIIPSTPTYIHRQTFGFIKNIKIMKKVIPNIVETIFSKKPFYLNK